MALFSIGFMWEWIFFVVFVDLDPGFEGIGRSLIQYGSKIFSLTQVMIFQIVPTDVDEVEVIEELGIRIWSG